jgi:hypothetical protein
MTTAADDDDLLDDMLGGPGGPGGIDADSDSGKPRSPRVFFRVPCLNSIELELMERSYREPALVCEVEFIDTATEGEPAEIAATAPTPETEADRVREAISAYWLERIAIARSLTVGTWDEYNDACKREGIEP